MMLTELRPKLVGTLERGILIFDAPNGRFRIHVHRESYGEIDGVKYWQAEGEFPATLTVIPSIMSRDWHGHILDGEVRPGYGPDWWPAR